MYTMAVVQHALTRRSKGQRWKSHSYENHHGHMAASGCCGRCTADASMGLHVIWLLRFLDHVQNRLETSCSWLLVQWLCVSAVCWASCILLCGHMSASNASQLMSNSWQNVGSCGVRTSALIFCLPRSPCVIFHQLWVCVVVAFVCCRRFFIFGYLKVNTLCPLTCIVSLRHN